MIWCTVCVLSISACDSRVSPYRIPTPVPGDRDGFSNALYQSTGVRLTPGHQVELVNDGAVFDRVNDELTHAQRSINIVMFIWRPSVPSVRLIATVIARAKAGVVCRVLLDAVGSSEFEKDLKPALTNAGCEVRFARLLKKGNTDNRNHRKIIVVDGLLAVTGGFGVDDEWLGDGRSKDQWRDTNLVVRGPAVNAMQQAFAENWQEAGGPLLPPSDFPSTEGKGPTFAGFVSSTASPTLTKADRVIQLMIAAATTRVWIATPYFTPSPGLQELLLQKRREGVDVRVMATGDLTDHRQVLREQRAAYPELLAGGVRLWEYAPSLFHPKTIVVDDHLSLVGSINLDRLSLTTMEEGSVVMSDPRVVDELVQAWEADVLYSREIRPP